MIAKNFLLAFTFSKFIICSSPSSWEEFIGNDRIENPQDDSFIESLNDFFKEFRNTSQTVEINSNNNNNNKVLDDNYEPPNKLIKNNGESKAVFNNDALHRISYNFDDNFEIFNPPFFNDADFNNSNQSKCKLDCDKSLIDINNDSHDILLEKDNFTSNSDQKTNQQNFIIPSDNTASNSGIYYPIDDNQMLKNNLTVPSRAEDNIQNKNPEKSIKIALDYSENSNIHIALFHTFSFPVTDFFDNDSSKALQAFLISNSCSYFAIKNRVISKFIIGKYDSNYNSPNCETFGGYTNSNNKFTKFKANCKRILTDSNGNLFILQTSSAKISEIIKLNHDFKLIDFICKNKENACYYLSNIDIVDMRIDSDILYLLDGGEKKIIISTLDFEFKDEIKCDFNFENTNQVFLAVSTKYITIFTPDFIHIYKKDDPKIYVKKEFEYTPNGFDFVEFIGENKIFVKIFKSNSCFVLDVNEEINGSIEISSAFHYIDIELDYARKGFRCCLSPDGEIYVATSKNDVKIFKIK